jgi:hypothetical protein
MDTAEFFGILVGGIAVLICIAIAMTPSESSKPTKLRDNITNEEIYFDEDY